MKITLICASLISFAAFTLWLGDGAWENGAMSTKGMIKVISFSSVSLLCFYLAQFFNKS